MGALSPAEPGPQLTCTEHWRLFTALSYALAYIQSQLDLGAFHALMLHFLLEQNPTSLGSTKPQTGRINSPCSYSPLLRSCEKLSQGTAGPLTTSPPPETCRFAAVVEPQSPRYNEAQWLLCLMSPMRICSASHPRMMAWFRISRLKAP